jgi:hypothetical protein
MTYDDLKEILKNNIGKEDNLLQGFSFESTCCNFQNRDKKYYCYEDSCNDYMFTRGLFLAKDKLRTKTSVLDVIIKSIEVDQWECPFLIKIPSKKLLKESLNDVSEKQKQSFKENLKTVFSFLNNSSIWVRVVDEDDNEAEKKAKDEFVAFADMGLYEYGSANENFDFNCRIQSQNWLEGDHGHDVTPILYGNESEFGEKLFKEHLIDSSNSRKSDSEGNVAQSQILPDLDELKKSFRFIDDFHDVAFRILLIDDKIGKNKAADDRFKEIAKPNTGNTAPAESSADEQSKNADIEINECPDNCDKCPISGTEPEPCKLCTIKKLMAHKKPGDTLKKKEKSFHYWNQYDIKTYYCQTVIQDFINDEKFDFPNGELNIECRFAPDIDKGDLHVQIIGVRDVRTALLLMSKFKFDIIFCDYLLDHKDNYSDERDYATQLFEFLSHEYKDDIFAETNPNKRNRLQVLNQFRHDVLDNRGPLGKYWIIPITGFNQTFIQDLYRKRIDLIDYKWNISNGADPITTPWQFLYHLNKFVELQLHACVFKMEQLLTFLLYSCEDLKILDDKFNKKSDFSAFQSFMGSEYATLMQLYGNKLPIKRDAKIDKEDSADKSVFATYIWDNFYADKKFVNEIELCRLMQRFYHQAATMFNDRNGCQRLNEAFENLCFFINTNGEVKKRGKTLLQELKKEHTGLPFLKEIIEKSTRNENKEDEKNK